MHLTCEHCGAAIAAGDINIDRAIAVCRSCHAVMSIPDRLSPPRPRVPQPRGLAFADTGTGLRITRRWFSPMVIGLLLFCVLWNGFLVGWYTTAFRHGAPFGMIAFPVIHVLVGVVLTYTVLTGFLNRTVIDLSHQTLTVRHGPLPWPGNTVIDATEIDQLYCEEVVTRGRSTTIRYGLHALMKDGAKVAVVTGLEQRDVALFLEQVIEEYLGIEDRPVRGELPR